MKLEQFFDRIYVINLKRRPDRLEKFFAGIAPYVEDVNNVILVEAIDGLAERPDLGLHAGKWGCAMSHIKTLKLIAENQAERTLIFEDDCEFYEDFEDIFTSAIQDVPESWDMLYFGANLIDHPLQIKNRIHKTTRCFAAHAYGVSKQFVENNHHIFSDYPEIDVQYANIQPMLNAYVIHPAICGQFASYSDLELKDVDYTHVFK
jgi:GR25 family glycosyltransferase involved in LPS biosynthesis